MERIEVKIEKGKDLYAAYSETVTGVWGSGVTAKAAIESLYKSVELFVSGNKPEFIPKELQGEYEFVFRYDVPSLVSAYKGILTPPVLESLSGVNQKLIHQYMSGVKKPRPAQRQRIEDALHEFGRKLLAVEL